MKLLEKIGLATRKFPLWLQWFNILCGTTALLILGFGVYHIVSSRRSSESVTSVLERPALLDERLATASGGQELGKALLGAKDDDALRVLDAAIGTCLPGSVSLLLELAGRESPSGLAAREELRAIVTDKMDPLTLDELRARGQKVLEKFEARDITLILAARAVVQSSPYRRRAAVERLAKLGDGRAGAALLAALGAPESEIPTRAAAEAGLLALAKTSPEAPDPVPPLSDGTTEGRWTGWWDEVGRRTFKAPPYDVERLGDMLLGRLEVGDANVRRDALRGVGIVRVAEAAKPVGRILLTEKDPTVRVVAAWALGRIGGNDAVEPLRIAIGDATAPLVRAAAARAVGRGRVLPLEADLVKLVEEKDESVRVAAAVGLLGFMNRSGVKVIDAIAFDPKRTPAERLAILQDVDDAGDGATTSAHWIAALSDPDDAVKAAAREALSRRVSSREVLVGRAAWEKWWRARYEGLGVEIPKGME